ncbi:MAG: prepilin peptidase [Lachnospiraceae bacterium]|nr:prepilin peptidase [Lachnospiraceae bacterium]NBJ82941.1 prepilin peptidase [bacterium 1XD42-76]NBK06232.1 prepilin peptidase [bacterium 1XD42-94]
MFHWQILSGLIAGLGWRLYMGGRECFLPETVFYTGRIAGTCALFYGLFLCRAMGAGDIKLMAVCTGFLGFWDGLFVIFLGLVLAGGKAAWTAIRSRGLREQWTGFFLYAVCMMQSRSVTAYPQSQNPEHEIRLGPYLFGGYCLFWGYRLLF